MPSPVIDADTDLWRKRKVVERDGVWTVEGRPRTQPKLLRVDRPSNIPGRLLVAVLVTVPPGAATPPHSHNGAALYTQVISGRVISQMIHPAEKSGEEDHDSGPNIYTQGEIWYEAPGCHHVLVENASTSEPAAFFATLVTEEVRIEGRGNDEECLIRSLFVLDAEERSPFNEDGERKRKEKQGEEEEVGWMCGWKASRM